MSVTTLIARNGVPDNSAAWARDAASMSLQTAPLSSIIGASVGEQSSELPVVQRPVLRRAPYKTRRRRRPAVPDAHGVVAGDGHAPVVVFKFIAAVDVADLAASFSEAAARARIHEEVQSIFGREERRQERGVRAHEGLAVDDAGE